MTETNPCSAHPSAPAAEAGASPRSADILLNLVVIFLAPVFLSASNGDIALARLAAIETVNSYRANSQADLLAVAQVVAFGFATLGSLCLSMADDISLTMVLRLRGNANALSRSAEAHRGRLEKSRANSGTQPAAPQPAQMENPRTQTPEATSAAPPRQAQPVMEAATPAPVSTPSAPANATQAPWAAGMAEAAEPLTAELPCLSPEEHRVANQAAAPDDCANNLLSEASVAPPFP